MNHAVFCVTPSVRCNSQELTPFLQLTSIHTAVIHLSSPSGESFDAKFDGKDYPIKGATGNYTVSLTKVNKRSIDITNKRDGKIVSVDHMMVSADGKTMTTKSENKETGATETTIAIKQ